MSGSGRTFPRRTTWVLLGFCALLDAGVGAYLLFGPRCGWGTGTPVPTVADWALLAGFVLIQGCLVALGLRLREPAVVIHI
jgi:hypothetical protein